ncbi:MAG: hypothetical protein JW844_01080 [Candidatus Omnitrophica bacterium]|nr:hypothetical protein [Candidatus Omnitrophota bacterium]
MDTYSTASILYYFNVLKKYWRFIAVVVIIATVISGLKGMRTPRSYTAEVVLLLPASEGGNSTSSSIGRFLGIPNLSGGGSSTSLLGAIIKSRKMAEDIVEHFNLADKTKPGAWESAIRGTKGKIFLPPSLNTVTLSIKASDRDPKRAAQIANFCAENLDNINEELQITTQKPMVKILDEATPPLAPNPRGVKKRALTSGLFAGLMCILGVFFLEYIAYLKRKKEPNVTSELLEEELSNIT